MQDPTHKMLKSFRLIGIDAETAHEALHDGEHDAMLTAAARLGAIIHEANQLLLLVPEEHLHLTKR